MKSRLVWKLSAVVATILAAAIAVSGYVNNLICAHYSLESARAFLRFNTESIVQGIGQLMMNRNNSGIEKLIVEISQESRVYGHIRLVSHHSGEIVASRFAEDSINQELTDHTCVVCHHQEDLGNTSAEIVSEVVNLPDGNRVLSVVAPISNEPRCRNAACHAHTDSPPILGFLDADYSLEQLDAMVTDRRMFVAITGVVSMVTGVFALWCAFAWLLERPIRQLIAGTKCIAAKQFDFRFNPTRNDEIGVLEASFDTMTVTIHSHQEELHRAKDYLKGIVENSADIIVTVDREGLIHTFNRGAEHALGYGRDEVIGQRIDMLFADSRDRDVAIARLTGTDNVKNYETRFLAKDGRVCDVLLTLSRLRDQEGNAIGTVGISKDITAEKELQRELIHSQKLAAIGQAVTGIQHAIRNMLSSLKGGAYLVRNGMAKDNRQWLEEGWAMVEEGIERISSLSNSMLDYARDWKPDLQRVDLGDLMVKICELNRSAAGEHGVALRCEVPDGLPPVLCDPKLIHLATTDLLVNAIDACTGKEYRSGESPEVVLKNFLSEGEELIVIEVRDNGCGMNEETRRSALVPFFSTKDNRGTGLGLAMAARIVNLHGGGIYLESEPGQGATFHLCLPIDGPKEDKAAVDAKTSAHH
ncbi:MAG: PAS domain-containing sensor histidine kinase [Pirellulaceae bacterium]